MATAQRDTIKDREKTQTFFRNGVAVYTASNIHLIYFQLHAGLVVKDGHLCRRLVIAISTIRQMFLLMKPNGVAICVVAIWYPSTVDSK